MIEERRRCTDIPCLGLFLGFLAGLGYVYVHSLGAGNLAKLSHGIDWRGRICGVDSEVVHQPLLFWCDPGVGEGLSLMDGVCVESCPREFKANATWCPGKAQPYEWSNAAAGDGGVRQMVVSSDGSSPAFIRDISLRPDYPSTDVLGYCFPSQSVLLHHIDRQVHISGVARPILVSLKGALQSWRFLLLSAAACVVTGYTFLLLIWVCFDKLVYLVGFALHSGLIGCAVGLGYMGVHDEHNVFGNVLEANLARPCAFLCSAVVALVWVLFALLNLHGIEAVRSTVRSVNSTGEVIGQLPSLLLQPLGQSVVAVLALALLLNGFLVVLSTAKVVPSVDPLWQHGINISGMQRTLEFSSMQWLSVIAWVFGIVWVLETVGALGRFSVSHAVVTHANFQRSECFPVLRSYFVGLGFHLGSLAFGGFMLASLKILAAVLTFLARQAHDEAGMRGALASAVCCCCAQAAVFVEQVLSMVNDLVYTDVALQASTYLEATKNVMRVAGSNPAEYALLKGSAMTVRVLGVCAIWGVSTLLAYRCLVSETVRSVLEGRMGEGALMLLESPSFPGTMTALVLINLNIAMTFMGVFYQTTHALTYLKLLDATTVGCRSPRHSSPALLTDTSLRSSNKHSVMSFALFNRKPSAELP